MARGLRRSQQGKRLLNSCSANFTSQTVCNCIVPERLHTHGLCFVHHCSSIVFDKNILRALFDAPRLVSFFQKLSPTSSQVIPSACIDIL